MYAVQPYTTGVAIVELPYLLAQAIMFMPIVYFLIGAATHRPYVGHEVHPVRQEKPCL